MATDPRDLQPGDLLGPNSIEEPSPRRGGQERTARSPSLVRKLSQRLFLLLALSSVSSSSALARPPEVDASERLVRRGVELRERGNDKRALMLFKRAYELDPTPVALAQM